MSHDETYPDASDASSSKVLASLVVVHDGLWLPDRLQEIYRKAYGNPWFLSWKDDLFS